MHHAIYTYACLCLHRLPQHVGVDGCGLSHVRDGLVMEERKEVTTQSDVLSYCTPTRGGCNEK
jgi:hypothetical protein